MAKYWATFKYANVECFSILLENDLKIKCLRFDDLNDSLPNFKGHIFLAVILRILFILLDFCSLPYSGEFRLRAIGELHGINVSK